MLFPSTVCFLLEAVYAVSTYFRGGDIVSFDLTLYHWRLFLVFEWVEQVLFTWDLDIANLQFVSMLPYLVWFPCYLCELTLGPHPCSTRRPIGAFVFISFSYFTLLLLFSSTYVFIFGFFGFSRWTLTIFLNSQLSMVLMVSLFCSSLTISPWSFLGYIDSLVSFTFSSCPTFTFTLSIFSNNSMSGCIIKLYDGMSSFFFLCSFLCWGPCFWDSKRRSKDRYGGMDGKREKEEEREREKLREIVKQTG